MAFPRLFLIFLIGLLTVFLFMNLFLAVFAPPGVHGTLVSIDSTTRALAQEYPGLLNREENNRVQHEKIRREGLEPTNVSKFIDSVQLPELYIVQAVAFSQPMETGAPLVFAGELLFNLLFAFII